MEPTSEAALILREALAQRNALHLKGARALHRERLARVLALTDPIGEGLDDEILAEARVTRALAQAARAEDARHGAGQLSRSAQRAPTEEDCEAGWRTVERIVRGAEEAAEDAERLAALAEDPRVFGAARAAGKAAKDARAIVDERNHAYTFHTDPGFSFGEGWYVAAAGVLCDIEIQVEPGQPQTAQVNRFLADVGLTPRAYRSRPRAIKALPALIADAFARDPHAMQQRLRRAFLGDEGVSPAVAAWTNAALCDVDSERPKVLVWVRDGVHDAHRNSADSELHALCRIARECRVRPVIFGDAPTATPSEAIDLSLCWKHPVFQGEGMRRAQLQLFEYLRQKHRLVGQVGVTTAGMDGPALVGLPTMYLTDAPNPRLGRWVGAVPGYEEVVRADGYQTRIGARLATWTSG
ncbi:MAG: hypothetical protein AAGE52_31290 [Myxococcota bacterium]